jgi:hypothetical protein
MRRAVQERPLRCKGQTGTFTDVGDWLKSDDNGSACHSATSGRNRGADRQWENQIAQRRRLIAELETTPPTSRRCRICLSRAAVSPTRRTIARAGESTGDEETVGPKSLQRCLPAPLIALGLASGFRDKISGGQDQPPDWSPRKRIDHKDHLLSHREDRGQVFSACPTRYVVSDSLHALLQT